jgi:hypothetical protein
MRIQGELHGRNFIARASLCQSCSFSDYEKVWRPMMLIWDGRIRLLGHHTTLLINLIQRGHMLTYCLPVLVQYQMKRPAM